MEKVTTLCSAATKQPHDLTPPPTPILILQARTVRHTSDECHQAPD